MIHLLFLGILISNIAEATPAGISHKEAQELEQAKQTLINKFQCESLDDQTTCAVIERLKNINRILQNSPRLAERWQLSASAEYPSFPSDDDRQENTPLLRRVKSDPNPIPARWVSPDLTSSKRVFMVAQRTAEKKAKQTRKQRAMQTNPHEKTKKTSVCCWPFF